jgi:hypothetical protein
MEQLSQNAKLISAAWPQLKNNGAADAEAVDCKGASRATFVFMVGATDTTVDAKLQEASASGGSYADISSASITQLGATDDEAIVAIEVDRRVGSRKRYVKPVITVGNGSTGANVSMLAVLTYMDDAPGDSESDAGLDERVAV